MNYDAKIDWGNLYDEPKEISFPAEGVIRIFKGTFRGLGMPKPTSGKILDLGCGDGRHFPLFQQIGLDAYGTEISDEICKGLKDRLDKRKISYKKIEKGIADNLPFEESTFDYLLTWNSCYYMTQGQELDFHKHVFEMARVIKQSGWIICSIPQKSSFIFSESKLTEIKGYRIISKDPWGKREGEIMRCFESKEELIKNFNKYFTKFYHAEIKMDWFGLNYHWYVFVAQKK